jgi:hypothetical protein
MILCALAMMVNLGIFSIVAGRWTPYRREENEEDFQIVAAVEMQTRHRSFNDD